MRLRTYAGRVLTTAILHPIFTLFTTFAKLFNIFNSYRRHNNILHLYPFSQCFARKIIYTDIVINVLNCQDVVIILCVHYIYANERSYFGCVIWTITHPILMVFGGLIYPSNPLMLKTMFISLPQSGHVIVYVLSNKSTTRQPIAAAISSNFAKLKLLRLIA